MSGIKNGNPLRTPIDLGDSQSVKKLIETTESGMYSGKNSDGEKLIILLQQGVGMDIYVYQNNGWVRIDDYGANGYKQGETFDGRWNKDGE